MAPKLSSTMYPYTVPASAILPKTPAVTWPPAAGVSPGATPPAGPGPGYSTAAEDFVARCFPVAGGNTLAASRNVQASQIVGPAEARWAALTDPVRAQAIVDKFKGPRP